MFHIHAPKNRSVKGSAVSKTRITHRHMSTVTLVPIQNSPVAVVLEANNACSLRRLDTHRSRQSIGIRKLVDAEFCAINAMIAIRAHRVFSRVLESSVADQFGIDATVARVVDIFVQEAVAGVEANI